MKEITVVGAGIVGIVSAIYLQREGSMSTAVIRVCSSLLAAARGFLLACFFVVFYAGCTPQQMLVQALIPDGTASMLLSHLQTVEDGNRRRVIDMEQRGDWAGLTRFADANIVTDPFSPEWRMIGGYAQLQLRDYARAMAYFREMIRLAPDDATGYHFLAETQRAARQPQRAVGTLERALLVVRESPLTHQLLGEAYSDLGRFRPASESYHRALALDPTLVDAWFGMGRASLQLGRNADAQDAVTELERLRSPRAKELRALLGK